MIPTLLFFIGGLSYTLYFPYGAELFALNAWRQEPLNTFFQAMTWLGEPPVWIAVALLLLWRDRPYGIVTGVTLALVAPVAGAVKYLAAVVRPNTWMEANQLLDYIVVVPGIKLLGGAHSMPSGHTTLAFALFSLSALMLPPKYAVAGIVFAWTAMLVGLSRIFLVQHFLSDVLAGAALGLLLTTAVWHFYKRWQTPRRA